MRPTTTCGEVTVQSAFAEVLGVRLSWAAVSDPGLVRSMNEDSVLAEPGMFVVADGMGGHAAGEVASRITVDTLSALASSGVESQGSNVPEALQQANQAIRSAAGEGRIIGSTVTGLVLTAFADRPTWLVWNIGDSRCYRVASDRLEQITRDHTVVADLLAAGAVTSEQAAHHPDRHVITRAVGADDELQADYWMLAPVGPERFLLCSDGLTNELSDAEIRDAVLAAESPSAAAIGLLALALERGGRDNVSAVVVFAEAADQPSLGGMDGAELDDTTPRPALGADRSTSANRSTTHRSDPRTGNPLISEVPA